MNTKIIEEFECENGGQGFMYFCCPCGFYHSVTISPAKSSNGASWTWNGSLDKPTFSPSIVVKVEFENRPSLVCHHYVKNGQIQYLSDCTHTLAGQTIDMELVE